MTTAWDRLPNLTNRCSDYYERVEVLRFVDSTQITHTCKPPIRNCLAVELVSACGRLSTPDIVITQGVNDKLDLYDSNGAKFAVTIPQGNYSYKELGGILRGLIEAATTGTENWAGTGYDLVNSRFILACSKAAAGINFATGPNVATSAAATLSFAIVDSVGASPYQSAVVGLNRSHCFHLASDALGRGRLYGVNDSDGPTGSLLWSIPTDDAEAGVSRIRHHPSQLVYFAWGQTQILSDFDIRIVEDSTFLLTGSTDASATNKFTGTIYLRFLVARNPEL